jgi:hypothetical protein
MIFVLFMEKQFGKSELHVIDGVVVLSANHHNQAALTCAGQRK